ncbi:MAG TPA: phage protein Gp36 family protein, partial [Roseomonas sp.]
IDAARVDLAIADAAGFADAYLRLRHTLPLAATPALLVRLTAAIARHELHLGSGRQATEQAIGERDAAIALLKDEAQGLVDFGIPVTGAGA